MATIVAQAEPGASEEGVAAVGTPGPEDRSVKQGAGQIEDILVQLRSRQIVQEQGGLRACPASLGAIPKYFGGILSRSERL